MSAYGDAFAITPQRSLPREKVAEMLERISQLNEEYEERKEIEDNPAYRQLLERRRSVEKKYVGDVQARGRAMEKVLAAGAPGELPGEVMAEEHVPTAWEPVSCVLWLACCVLTVIAVAMTIAIPDAPRFGMIAGCSCLAIGALTMRGDGKASLKLKQAQTRWDRQFNFDSSAETDTAFLEECENFDAKYRENAADVRMLRQTAKEQYDAEVRPIEEEIARFEADEQTWRTAAETEMEMESFDLLPENYRYLAGNIAAIVRGRRAHSLTDALNLAIREEKEEAYRESQMDAMAARNAILREQARSEELHQKQMQELERQRIENERAANERLLAAQREQARAADRRLEQEQTRQRREAEKARIEADKARQTEDVRRRRREYAANQIKLAKNQQSKDYWESEWKRNL